ncbi:DUF4276 family protein [Sporolactobacillus sp. CPB3-1]|uniref:DUF4276 family protein n=1 Tax=Sporolactobacillus mangiferae TaxID=2940498 RepID=A0ABT0MBP8_9BACL|nr:DUF4276 family protein [Sporolactobacillus mangiferae]MCL1632291.1 DUF4276 family protein [Sporolactobacillus mangiferae]
MVCEPIYIQFLIEDPSGKIVLENIMNKYVSHHEQIIYRINSFKGIGRLQKKYGIKDIKTKQLLNDLPQYLEGFDRSLSKLPYRKAIIVVVDNDDKDCAVFKQELLRMQLALKLTIEVNFCIAIEEIEAWLLGDLEAVRTAYPDAKQQMLNDYQPDSIVGTWEYLANAVYKGGIRELKKEAYYEIGKQKCKWAEEIGQFLDLSENRSPSFKHLLSKLDALCQ